MAGPHRFMLLPVLLLAPTATASAQTIRGHVVEGESRTPVGGAEVELVVGDAGGEAAPRTTTDSLGVFILLAPRAGVYGLRVTHPAYRTYEADSIAVQVGETVSLEVRLGINAIPIDPMVVTARSTSTMTDFEHRRTLGGFGRFLTREDIEARAAGRTTELLRGISGVTIRQAKRGRTSYLLMRSGLGLCQPALWLDGHLVQQVEGSTVDDFLLPDQIEGVEVYRSSAEAPVQYVTGPCGVILFWTRPGSSEGGKPWHWKKVLAGVGAALGAIILFVH